jgi:hypothetical protein
MSLEIIEQHIADVFNIAESLKELFKKSGNPKIPPTAEIAMDIVRRLEGLQQELMKI